MSPRVTGIRYIQGYRLELHFSDNSTAELDFQQLVVGRGGVFLAMEELDFFKQVEVDREAGTIAWPNGADFCPDVLCSLATSSISRARRG